MGTSAGRVSLALTCVSFSSSAQRIFEHKRVTNGQYLALHRIF